MKISFVFSLQLSMIFLISAVLFVSLTSTGLAPAARADILYIAKPCSV